MCWVSACLRIHIMFYFNSTIVVCNIFNYLEPFTIEYQAQSHHFSHLHQVYITHFFSFRRLVLILFCLPTFASIPMAMFKNDVRARTARISHTMTKVLEVNDLVFTSIGSVMHGIVNSDVGSCRSRVGRQQMVGSWTWRGLYFSYFILTLSQT